jgi:sporulation protein YlmC with PRC-barrel domain
MVKFIGRVIGAKVLLFQERAQVGEVLDVLIDADDGAFVGLEISSSISSEPAYVPASEIKGFGQGFVLIKQIESLSSAEEVVRIKKVIENRPKILNAKVYNETGRYIGKVEDATLSFKLLALEKIYINPRLTTKFLAESLIISARMIVRIEPNKIIIKDDAIQSKEPKYAPKAAPATD